MGAGPPRGKVGMPQNIMRALCAVIRPDHFKFASYGTEAEETVVFAPQISVEHLFASIA